MTLVAASSATARISWPRRLRRALWSFFCTSSAAPLIYILLAATLVTLLLEEFFDAGVIAAVLMLNAIIGFSQARRAEQSVRALMRLMAPKAHVVRAGREWSIESRELVSGDVVLLESGARVPADLRLFSATALRVDESLLTGESLPVTKTTAALEPPERPLADRTNMVFMGTIVATGRGPGCAKPFRAARMPASAW